MNLIKPQKLRKGDTIAFLALSGVIEQEENIHRAKKYFEDLGYKVVFSKNLFDKNRYLAGSDEIKVKELHRFFKDSDVKMILCARGGYGTIRLIDKVDFELIKSNPKIFAGYSDVTGMQAMIYKKSGLVTFYAPHAQSDFGVVEISEVVQNSFFNTVTNEGGFSISPEKEKATVYHKGEANGVFWGGNLTTLVSLCGQDFIPDEKFIFFAEDLNEVVYKIDRMMTQLFNIEKFRENLQGIVLGDFLDIESQDNFDNLFYEIGKKYKVPILGGFQISHDRDKLTVPYGAMASMSTKKMTLKFENYLD